MNTKIALERYNSGEPYFTSTFIDEDTILAGYGNLDYDFEFSLPREIIIKEFGTTSWREYFKLKGLFSCVSTCKSTGKQSLIQYINEEEFKTLVKENPNFDITKL